VPRRLGTLWARPDVDMTVKVRAVSAPRTIWLRSRAPSERSSSNVLDPADAHRRLCLSLSLSLCVEAPPAWEER
jgi:hypothetical protein